MTRRALPLAGLALAFLAVLAVGLVPSAVESRLNAVLDRDPYRPSLRARELHRKLLIADLHADSLLWGRDLLSRGGRGHVDVPRLIEGNVAVQGFTVVTKTPRFMSLEGNDDRTDDITLLALFQRWPRATWGSLKERALYQARRLQEAVGRSAGKLHLIRTAAELDSYLNRRSRDRGLTAGFLGIEGAHALEGEVGNVDALFEAGFRMMALAHFFDNEVAGSAHGLARGGLTTTGRAVVRRMEERGMIVDLAHASARTIDDVLAMAARPVVVSHTGVRGTCDNVRNLEDRHVRGVARTGGLVGIGYWETAVCGADGRAVARAIRHAADLAGPDHVALGSDFDGAVTMPFDTAGLVEVTDALLELGFSETEIGKIMGGNTLRLLRQQLP